MMYVDWGARIIQFLKQTGNTAGPPDPSLSSTVGIRQLYDLTFYGTC